MLLIWGTDLSSSYIGNIELSISYGGLLIRSLFWYNKEDVVRRIRLALLSTRVRPIKYKGSV